MLGVVSSTQHGPSRTWRGRTKYGRVWDPTLHLHSQPLTSWRSCSSAVSRNAQTVPLLLSSLTASACSQCSSCVREDEPPARRASVTHPPRLPRLLLCLFLLCAAHSSTVESRRASHLLARVRCCCPARSPSHGSSSSSQWPRRGPVHRPISGISTRTKPNVPLRPTLPLSF